MTNAEAAAVSARSRRWVSYGEDRGCQMSTLHLVQGGVENGDKAWLEKAARFRLSAKSWIVPKSAGVGDEAVIFVSGYGFFATACIESLPKPRKNWARRYGAGVGSVQLIQPAISLGAIQRALPGLTWANYPRSITTPPPAVADRIKALIARRCKTHLPDLDDESLEGANIDELREVALLNAQRSVVSKKRGAYYRARSLAIRLYVLCRAEGRCEACQAPAPFRKADGSPYLEPHHTTRLADDGPDHPVRVIGLCPNCHRRAHYGVDAKDFNGRLKKRLVQLEPR